MKVKILKFLKDKWWKILLYFLVFSLGMFIPFLYVDIKEFRSHKKNRVLKKTQKLNKNNKPFTKMVFLFVKPKLLINWFRERIAS